MCYASKYDVSFLYREIFQERVYLQHGVQLAQGDVVVDVGGNIGFFALFAAQQVGPGGKVITLEPIPPLHNKLVYNVKLIVHTHSNLAEYIPGLQMAADTKWLASIGTSRALARLISGMALMMSRHASS